MTEKLGLFSPSVGEKTGVITSIVRSSEVNSNGIMKYSDSTSLFGFRRGYGTDPGSDSDSDTDLTVRP